jgi:hypothetical protein
MVLTLTTMTFLVPTNTEKIVKAVTEHRDGWMGGDVGGNKASISFGDSAAMDMPNHEGNKSDSLVLYAEE